MPFCNKCGTEVPESANFCQKCGGSVMQSEQANAADDSRVEAIWNPTVAVCLGLLLSSLTIFLHYLNWKTLKQEKEAKSSLIWCIITFISCTSFLFITDVILGTVLYYLLFIIWYFAIGKKQIKYVKEKYGAEYKRKSWKLPIVALFVVYFMIYFISVVYEVTSEYKGIMTDERDGKMYKTVKIGKQIWMAENLNYDGGKEKAVREKILKGIFNSEHPFPYDGDGSIGKCYDNDNSNCEKYGRLYDWPEAMGGFGGVHGNDNALDRGENNVKQQGICPAGWHLPSYSEWEILYKYISGSHVESKLKAREGWKKDRNDENTGNGTDDYGFAALPGGFDWCSPRFDDTGNNVIGCIEENDFSLLGSTGFWWSATKDDFSVSDKAKFKYIPEGILDEMYKLSSLSVRCVKDK